MELVTAIAVASAAFNFVKKGIETGKELEGMSQQLGKWFEATSAFKVHEKAITNPPLFKKLLFKGSVEQEALQIVMHRKQIERQEIELRELIMQQYGLDTYREMLQMRRQIAVSRDNMLLKRKQAFKAFRLNALLLFLISSLLGLLAFLVSTILNK